MHHAINHVHIRSTDPEASAAWYTEHFGVKRLGSREVMPGTVTISMDPGGPVRLNISSPPPGSSDKRAVAEINQLGLEHFGFHTEDIDADMAHFKAAGTRVVMPIRETPGGGWISYIEGPDDVVIELVQMRD